MTQKREIGFIGGGNMAEALIAGLLKSRSLSRSRIAVSDPVAERRTILKRRFGIRVTSSNIELVKGADVVILAVKPQVMASVVTEIAPVIKNRLFISIAAGIGTSFLHRFLGRRIVRAMPNTPALAGRGMTGIFPSGGALKSDLKVATEIFSSVGEVVVFKKESMIDLVTAISGSGPAYVFLFLESLIKAGMRGGISGEGARSMAIQTLEGAAILARCSSLDMETLRKNVTSKGGTTEAALKVLKKKGWGAILEQAIVAATRRAKELKKGTLCP